MPSAKPGDTAKTCTRCKESKVLDDFSRNSNNKDGLSGICRTCWNGIYRERRDSGALREYNEANRDRIKQSNRNSARKRKYAIEPGEFERMYNEQEGRCYLCFGKGENLVVDHNHETGVIRGLMHNNCNAGLGMMGDSDGLLYHIRLYFEFVEKR